MFIQEWPKELFGSPANFAVIIAVFVISIIVGILLGKQDSEQKVPW